jgi:hypothetical protein
MKQQRQQYCDTCSAWIKGDEKAFAKHLESPKHKKQRRKYLGFK